MTPAKQVVQRRRDEVSLTRSQSRWGFGIELMKKKQKTSLYAFEWKDGADCASVGTGVQPRKRKSWIAEKHQGVNQRISAAGPRTVPVYFLLPCYDECRETPGARINFAEAPSLRGSETSPNNGAGERFTHQVHRITAHNAQLAQAWRNVHCNRQVAW